MAERTGAPLVPPFEAFGWERNGEIAVGVVANCYTGPDVQITVAGGPWSRELLRELGAYVYDELGCCRMSFVTEQPAVADMALRCGARVEGVIRSCFGPGRDGIALGILAGEWRFV